MLEKRGGLLGEAAAAPAIVSHTGSTRAGDPLSLSRPPGPDLLPWISLISGSVVTMPADVTLSCRLFSDNAAVRVLISGRWRAQCRDGWTEFNPDDSRQALFFGPQSRAMPIEATGTFRVMTVQLRPGASRVLGGPDMRETLDRIIDFDEMVGHGRLGSRFDPARNAGEWITAYEAEMRKMITRHAVAEPDPVTRAFEIACFARPNIAVGEFAEAHGVGVRTLERIVMRDFGMTPKQVLRRARALDMASLLLGVAAPDEAEALHLRYFDQSHQIREISHFFGISPSQLAAGTHPLLRLNLEARQNRRLLLLEEGSAAPPTGLRPWRDPAAEPGA